MKQIYVMALLLGSALSCAAPAGAQSQRYVSEDGVELYDAPSQDANIVTMLVKGTALDVLGPSADGYTHVHTPDDWQGFVISQFLVDSRPLEAVTAYNVPLQAPALQTQNGTGETLLPVNDERSQGIARMSGQKPVGRDADSATDDSLKTQLAAAQSELRMVNEDNRQLRNENKRDWFLAGAGVLLIGLMLGIFIAKMEGRRNSWHSY
jgi:SH3 domain protein